MKKLLLPAAALIASAISAQASTITPAAGLNLDANQTQSASIQVFSEGVAVAAAANAVTLDYLVGTNLSIGDDADGVSNFASGQSLAAGSYNSFLVHFDPITAGNDRDVLVDFGHKIVGVIVSNSNGSTLLNASDAVFGTAANYDTSLGRRAENADGFSFTNAHALTFSLAANSAAIDNIRVITEVAPVPLPASLPLLLAGLGGFAALRRRRKTA